MSQDKHNKVILVTGALQGLGLEIVKQLANSDDAMTILASARSPRDMKITPRNPSSKILYPKLDVTKSDDVRDIAVSLKELGGIDVLVHCAGLSFETMGIEDMTEVMEKTLSLNYYGTTAILDAVLPLMSRGGRIVILSSSASHDSKFDNDTLHKRVTNPNITREELDDLVKEYSVAGINPAPGSGWTTSMFGSLYSSVKAFLNILTRIVARDRPELLVNAICPGASYTTPRVQDGMPIKFKTAAQGASEPVRLAIGDINGISGKYWAGDTLNTLKAEVIEDWMGHAIKPVPRELPDGPLFHAE